jgi:hypothetical protein
LKLKGKIVDPPEQTDGEEDMEVMAPLLFAISLHLFKAIQVEGRPLVPHEVHVIVMAIVFSTVDARQRMSWNLFLTGVS